MVDKPVEAREDDGETRYENPIYVSTDAPPMVDKPRLRMMMGVGL